MIITGIHKHIQYLILAAGLFFFTLIGLCADNIPTAPVKTILYIASYNTANPWSRGIQSGIESVLAEKNSIRLQVFNMDTMGMHSDQLKSDAAQAAKKIIETTKPDLVIVSDDNACKYLVVPYYKNSTLPIVFCGVNWDAAKYGFPTTNITGVLEVQLVDQLVHYLSPYAKGTKVGSLRGNTMTNRIEAKHFSSQLNREITTYFVNTFSEWKEKFLQLQEEVDMVLLGDIDTIELGDESQKDVEKFIYDNTRIPTGHWDAWFKQNALITVATIPEEQGEYAALAALEILDGKAPCDINIVKNRKAEVYLNMKMAKKLGIIFPMNLISSARLIPAD